MNSLGFKSVVYHGDFCLGEVKILPAKTQNFQFLNNEIRINHISQTSDRCIPLAIFQTISSSSILCKLETNSSTTTTNDKSQLIRLHASCFHERKTAVVVFGKEEIHLVAMPSKEGRFPCFWCFSVPLGLYENCLEMLKIRCLAIVFDLDETLIVGNSMKSFEDKIGFLQSRMAYETEPDRISVISAELKRYTDDRSLLKQYVDADSVMDNGKLLRVQMEEVPAVPGRQDRLFRPVIRLQERNIVLTRINPEIRDTSVLVRLRPDWEDLRSYLIAGGRKRFEVYVCTMAENDYALEMWRLLDPETHLISLKQLVDRVVCVKSGCRKSLQNVFHNRTCHPKMAMVIDDRLNVWDDKDQPRVYGVPPFVPYLDPQMETANSLPALRVARNVASTVRSGFFKEFDENLLRTISSVCYEDDTANLPSPDVGNFLTSEKAGFVPNGIVKAPFYEGIAGAEVDRSWNWVDHRNTTVDTSTPFGSNYRDPRPGASLQPVTISHNSFGDAASRTFASLQNSTLPGGSTRGHVNPSEIDPEARRRYLAMQQGHLMRKQGFKNPLSRPLPPVSALSEQSRGGWMVEENSGTGYPKNRAATMAQGVSAPHKPQDYQASNDIREIHTEGRKICMRPSAISTQVLQEIGRKCETKVEFKLDGSTFKDLQFSFEVFFNGERVGYGKGRTKADAQNQAAEDALHNLAGKYATIVAPDPGVTSKDLRKGSLENENGFLWE